MKFIETLYWKLFFSAYYVAKDLGDNNSPQRKACSFLEISLFLILIDILNIITFINREKPDWYLI